MATDIELSETMNALVLKSPSTELTVEIVPTPKPAVGSAVVRVLSERALLSAGSVPWQALELAP
jgi:hypothetical protein